MIHYLIYKTLMQFQHENFSQIKNMSNFSGNGHRIISMLGGVRKVALFITLHEQTDSIKPSLLFSCFGCILCFLRVPLLVFIYQSVFSGFNINGVVDFSDLSFSGGVISCLCRRSCLDPLTQLFTQKNRLYQMECAIFIIAWLYSVLSRDHFQL